MSTNWTPDQMAERIRMLENDLRLSQDKMKEMRGVLEDVVNQKGEAVSGGDRWCVYCDTLSHGNTINHAASCPVTRARKLLDL